MNVHMFVYGTLRYGDGNWGQSALSRSVDQQVTVGCRVRGRLYNVSGTHPVFPVAKLDEEGEIWGDLMVFDSDHPTYDHIVRVEQGAGYEIRPVEVVLPSGAKMSALAWHYLREPRGELIANGNWLDYSARTLCQEL